MADRQLSIRILTPECTLFEGVASAVSLPGAFAPFEVLPGHAPIISTLEKGIIRIASSEETSFEIIRGVVRVRDNQVTVCAEI